MMNNWIVVTTINHPTEAIVRFSKLSKKGWNVVVVGDEKTPKNWTQENITYLSIDMQDELFGDLSRETPRNHYCRKNIGYLYAIKNGARCILETDDDNIPYEDFGSGVVEIRRGRLLTGARWVNVYKYFTNENIWPRGTPLDEIQSVGRVEELESEYAYPIQQYLADQDPDVDAVYRLTMNKEIVFNKNTTIGVEKNSWVPFNSQNTVFFQSAFPLLYLPCNVSFRMTDIWRSFVAQRVLWCFDRRIAFHSSTVMQVRNEHNLMHDFIDEIPGYINNKKIADLLDECSSLLDQKMEMGNVAKLMWETLCSAGIIPEKELKIYDLWAKCISEMEMNRT